MSFGFNSFGKMEPDWPETVNKQNKYLSVKQQSGGQNILIALSTALLWSPLQKALFGSNENKNIGWGVSSSVHDTEMVARFSHVIWTTLADVGSEPIAARFNLKSAAADILAM